MMGYVARTAGNRYMQSVLVAMPTAGVRIAESSLNDAGVLLHHEPEAVHFPEIEVGGASDAMSIRISTTSMVPIEIDDIEVQPISASQGPPQPGEFIAWETKTRAIHPYAPLDVDVQFHPAQAKYMTALLRIHGHAAGAPVTHQVRLLGRGVAAKKEHLDDREASVARLEGRILSSSRIKPPTSTTTYNEMLASVYAASRLCPSSDRADELHARELLLPVSRRLDELAPRAREQLRQFGAGNHAGLSALSMSQAAIADWIQKISLGATIEPDHLVQEFEIGSETIRFLTGERDDAKDLRGFDHATRLVDVGAAGLLASPAIIALAVQEAGLLAFIGRARAMQLLLWGAAHPVMATELVSSLVGVGPAIKSWDDFVQALQDPREAAFLLMQIAMELVHLHQARAGTFPRAETSDVGQDDLSGVRGELRERVQTVRVAVDEIQLGEHGPAPSAEDYAAMYRASEVDTGQAIRLAEGLAKNPNTIYHHNIGKGGTRAIVESGLLQGGQGTASFGGESSVRAWFGEARVNPASPRMAPTIEFTVDGVVPDVRP